MTAALARTDRHTDRRPRLTLPLPGRALGVKLAGLVCGVLWACAPGPAQAAPNWVALPAPIALALQAANVPPEAVSMLVLPVDGGPARLEHDAHAIRTMASVMKLFTTGAALTTLGPAYTWRTDVALGGPLHGNGQLEGPLYIKGAGDPSLVLEYVQLMVSRWRAAGLKEIRGDILIDRSAFDLPAHDPAAFDGQALKPYNAGPDALLLNHQAISLRFMPDAAHAGQVRVSMEPELEGVKLDARLRLQPSGACGDWREALDLRLAPAPGPSRLQHGFRPWTLSLRGAYPAACGAREWPVLWQGDGAGDHAARLLAATWRQAGGRLSGEVKPGQWPQDAVVWQSWVSPPLTQLVRDINKFSNNVMARELFLALSPAPGPATLERARAATARLVQASTRDSSGLSPCDGEALALDNGSGLSRTEHSSARCLARWLQAMWASPVMPEFVASLPIAGTDGTARRLSSVAGKAHIKTGSLDGVVALAGYVEGDSGRRHIVIGVVNHPQAEAARPALQALIGWAVHDLASPAGNQN